jgi:multidrug efflux system membrane fusion protein
MKKHAIFAGLCLAAFAGSFAVIRSYRPAAMPQKLKGPLAIPVNATKVQVDDVSIVLTGIGSVQAVNVVDMHTQVTGTIQKIGFVEGQTIHKGSLIAQLDARPLEVALRQAEANLACDEAQLTNSQVNFNRDTPPMKLGFASTQQVADQESQVAQLQASIAADKAAMFSAQTQLSYTTITSPIDGVTGIRRADLANIVQPATTTPIVTITQIQPISVVFTLPQNDVPEVQAAMAKGTLRTLAYGRDNRTMLGEGTLLLVNNMIRQPSGTAELKAIFPNENRALWPGSSVNVRLIVADRHDAITIPLSALQQDQNGAFVFVVAPDGTVQSRSVTVSETLDGKALIDHGLHPAETVVTSVPVGDPRVQDSMEASAGIF